MAWNSKGFKKYYRKGKKYAKNYMKSNSAWDIAQKAMYGVKALREVLNPELSYKLSADTGSNVDYGGTITNLCQIAQGDNVQDRKGNSILVKSLHLRYTLAASASVTTTFTRVIVLMDTMNQGVAPVVSDILQNTDSADAVISLKNVNSTTMGRFHILYDKVHPLSNTGHLGLVKNLYLKMNSHVKYDGTAAADSSKNTIYIVSISNLTTTNLPVITYHARLNYYDN